MESVRLFRKLWTTFPILAYDHDILTKKRIYIYSYRLLSAQRNISGLRPNLRYSWCNSTHYNNKKPKECSAINVIFIIEKLWKINDKNVSWCSTKLYENPIDLNSAGDTQAQAQTDLTPGLDANTSWVELVNMTTEAQARPDSIFSCFMGISKVELVAGKHSSWRPWSAGRFEGWP